ncbi:hypothetical protein A3I58_03895 [Candidatus Peregrinibacteria bacterium RIFCSPLOWO2_02_FULL_39_10]|nr:MAG: hypothetical protein A3I58_03895 [Candidatus Peregrinibacteria bacterium RIFCSPLOWO2_02_FULL_39_10]
MPDESINNLIQPEPTSVSAEMPSPVETTTPSTFTPTEPVAPPPDPLPSEYSGQALSKGGGTDIRSLLAKALAKIQFRKQAKLEKIMVLARSKGQVTNDDAQKLLRVSDATATRYLSELVKNGRLRVEGRTSGRRYLPVQ